MAKGKRNLCHRSCPQPHGSKVCELINEIACLDVWRTICGSRDARGKVIPGLTGTSVDIRHHKLAAFPGICARGQGKTSVTVVPWINRFLRSGFAEGAVQTKTSSWF